MIEEAVTIADLPTIMVAVQATTMAVATVAITVMVVEPPLVVITTKVVAVATPLAITTVAGHIPLIQMAEHTTIPVAAERTAHHQAQLAMAELTALLLQAIPVAVERTHLWITLAVGGQAAHLLVAAAQAGYSTLVLPDNQLLQAPAQEHPPHPVKAHLELLVDDLPVAAEGTKNIKGSIFLDTAFLLSSIAKSEVSRFLR